MTKLSHTTQKVLDTIVHDVWEMDSKDVPNLTIETAQYVVATLRAIVDIVTPKNYESFTGYWEHEKQMLWGEGWDDCLKEIVTIIEELKNLKMGGLND